jgi:hypothetical protein
MHFVHCCCADVAACQGGAIFAKSYQMLPAAKQSNRGLLRIQGSHLTNNTSGFGGALCCWHCRAEVKESSIGGNLALYTLKEWYGHDKMLGHETPNLYIPGLGGALAAVFDKFNSFVVVGNDTTLERNAAQMLGGAVYMYSSDECSKSGDKWNATVAQYGLEHYVAACGMYFSYQSDGAGENKAMLGGDVLAWTGQSNYSPCCSNANGSMMTCSSEGEAASGCDDGRGGEPAANNLIATLPAQVLVYNTSCLPNGTQFRPNETVSQALDDCLLGFSKAPGSTSLYNDSFQKRPVRLYSGHQLNITAVVIDGYSNVMDVSKSDEARLARFLNRGDGQIGGAEDLANQAVQALSDPQLMVEKTHPDLFVIGKLTRELQTTASFTDVALQPVVRPVENAPYSFALKAGEGSSILRQVS